MSSVAMALSGCGKNYNPSTLNTWLKGHGGYVSGDLFVWGSVGPLGLAYGGKIGNADIGSHLNAQNVVILNVHGGAHWVLATGISGSTVSVNDPGYSTSSYTLGEIVAGQTSIFKFTGSPSKLTMMISELEYILNVSEHQSETALIEFN